MSSIYSIFPLCMESNALEKLTNNIVASRFFSRMHSRIQWRVKICDVVDLFLQTQSTNGQRDAPSPSQRMVTSD